MMKSVVVAHSWSLNMGDAAMLRTITDIVHGVSPKIRVTALVSHPEFTIQRCSGLDAEFRGWPWPVPKGKPGALDMAITYPLIYLNNLASASLFRLLGIKAFLFNRRFARPLESIFDCDALVCPGGDFISPRYFFHSAFGEIIMARILGKRIIVLAQTIGPFMRWADRKLAAFVLNMADIVIVREDATARHLKELGVRSVEVTSDLAFMFRARRRWRLKRKRSVVICPKRISGDCSAYVRGISTLVKRLVDERGYVVEFLPSDAYDAEFQSQIASMLGGRVAMAGEVYSPEEIAERMSGAGFVVSSRMHAIILATLSGTPFFAVGDSHKFEAILGNLCEGCTIGIDELDGDGVDRILEAVEGRERIAASIRKRYPAVLAMSKKNEEILRSKFVEWGFAEGR